MILGLSWLLVLIGHLNPIKAEACNLIRKWITWRKSISMEIFIFIRLSVTQMDAVSGACGALSTQ